MRTTAIFILMLGAFATSGAYAEESSRWIAVAATHWRDGSGAAHSAIGYSGIRRSQDEAAASALDACKSSGGVGCKVLGAWDSGCIYITSGSSSEKAGYGAGESVAQALGNCRGEGLVCKPPVGGCIE
jgi:uncharacterized protein DUF4189